MKIALTMEKSQASKNAIVAKVAERICQKYGYEFYNYGVLSPESKVLPSYGQMAVLTGTILNAGAADLVLTGCGTGMGALIAANAMPGVECGFAADPLDARLLREVNNPNAVVTPFDKGWGWAAEYNLELMYEEIISSARPNYLSEKTAAACIRCKNELDYLKGISSVPFMSFLKECDVEILKIAFSGENFKKYFYPNACNHEIAEFVKSIVG